MTHFDVFSGDADGICALQQLRLATPRKATLVTGVKRNIVLLAHVPAVAGDEVTVLDLSLDRNRKALLGLLENEVHVRYFDHHFPGPIPEHPGLDAHIETLPDRGASLLVNDFLGGRFRTWAVVDTFGDSFDATARRAADPLELNAVRLATLRELGICLNYNAYGAHIQDLYFAPDVLFRRLEPYADPFDFIAADTASETLRTGYAEDMAWTRGLQPELMDDRHALYNPARRALGPSLGWDPGQPTRPHLRTTGLCPADPAAGRRIRGQRASTHGGGNRHRHPVVSLPDWRWPQGRCRHRSPRQRRLRRIRPTIHRRFPGTLKKPFLEIPLPKFLPGRPPD